MFDDLESVLFSEEQINERIVELGRQISEDFADRDLFAISVLKGSVIFLADIVRSISIPMEFGFVTISTYGSSTTPQNKPTISNQILPCLKGKDVLLVEDILDTGRTLHFACDWLNSLGVASLKVCVLLAKEGYEHSEVLCPDYVGFDIPDKFVVGYGLDYDEKYRNLPCIGVLKPSVYE